MKLLLVCSLFAVFSNQSYAAKKYVQKPVCTLYEFYPAAFGMDAFDKTETKIKSAEFYQNKENCLILRDKSKFKAVCECNQ